MADPVSSFLLNTVLSFATSTISSWLFPTQKQRTTEDTPQADIGYILPFVWGETVISSSLLCKPSYTLYGSDGDEYDWLTVLTFANPDPTADYLAVKYNGYMIGSKSSAYALNLPESKTKNKYVTSQGLKVYESFFPQYQLATNAYNDQFVKLGYKDLRYEGLSWFSFYGHSQKFFGSYSSRQTFYVCNALANTYSVFIRGENADPIYVLVRTNVPAFIGGWSVASYFNSTAGFRGARQINDFQHVSGGVGRQSTVAAANGYDVVLLEDMASGLPLTFEVKSGITGEEPAGAIGEFIFNARPLDEAFVPVFTDTVIVGAVGQKMRTVTLTQQRLAPFRNERGGTDIYDYNGTLVGFLLSGERVYGWGGNVFTAGDNPFYYNDLTYQEYVTNTTTLYRIMRDMLLEKGINASKIIFNNYTDVVVKGYFNEMADITSDLITLATCYRKVVVDGLDGEVIISDYPTNAGAVTIGYNQVVDPAEIEITSTDSRPTALRFYFRNFSKQCAEDSVLVGHSDTQYSQTIRTNITFFRSTAVEIAWQYFQTVTQSDLAIKVRLDSSALTIAPLDVIDLNITPTESVRLLVLNREISVDRTIEITGVRYVNLYPLTTTQLNSAAEEPTYGIAVQSLPRFAIVLNTEPRYDSAGSGKYLVTESESVTNVNSVSGIFSTIPTKSLFRGNVTEIEKKYSKLDYGVTSVTVKGVYVGAVPAAAGVLRIGESWVKYANRVSIGSDLWKFEDISIGQHSSASFIAIGSPVYVVENNPLPTTPIVSITQNNENVPDPIYTPTITNKSVSYGDMLSTIEANVLRIWLSVPGATADNHPFLPKTGRTLPAGFLRVTRPNSAVLVIPHGQNQYYIEVDLSTTPLNPQPGEVLTISNHTPTVNSGNFKETIVVR